MKEFEFQVSEQEANLIVGALAKMPFESVAALIAKIQQQAQAQMAPQADAEKAN